MLSKAPGMTGVANIVSSPPSNPESIGIGLDRAGWVDVDVFLTAMVSAGYVVDESDVNAIVNAEGKRRYEVQAGRIRASQGHSVDVDLGLEPAEPPPTLYHGTVDRFMESIRAKGLVRGERTHVHLSADEATARDVGGRRGKPIVLTIDGHRMYADGHKFLLAANGVWLVEHVPPEFLVEPGRYWIVATEC